MNEATLLSMLRFAWDSGVNKKSGKIEFVSSSTSYELNEVTIH